MCMQNTIDLLYHMVWHKDDFMHVSDKHVGNALEVPQAGTKLSIYSV